MTGDYWWSPAGFMRYEELPEELLEIEKKSRSGIDLDLIEGIEKLWVWRAEQQEKAGMFDGPIQFIRLKSTVTPDGVSFEPFDEDLK